MQRLLTGASYPFRAAALLARTPGLWPLVVVPVLVNIAVGVLVYAGLLVTGLRAIDGFIAGLPPELGPVEPLLQLALVLTLLLVTGWVLVRFGVILGAPWYDVLSARVEQGRTGEPVRTGPGGPFRFLVDLFRQLGEEVQKLALVGAVFLLLLAMNLLPVVGTLLAAWGGIALGTTLACLDFIGPSLGRRRLGLGGKMGAIRRAMPASAGFGLVCLALVSVPLVNLLSIPLCVVAGALFYADLIRTRAQAATRASRTPTS